MDSSNIVSLSEQRKKRARATSPELARIVSHMIDQQDMIDELREELDQVNRLLRLLLDQRVPK